ncbi:hypothetical protein B7494_g6079 [Chlorociboria aeruginascens]|nr:hypothetical protein B7494_g6079 [Chlorociboria aeruginascens]
MGNNIENMNTHNSFQLPQDNDYALTILTNAATQTHHSTPDSSSSGYEHQRWTTATDRITNHPLHLDQPQRHSSRMSEDVDDYNPHALPLRRMDALPFNHAPYVDRRNAYMDRSYQGISGPLPPNLTQDLGILNAEHFDDRRGVLRANEERERRLKQQQQNLMMPFGLTEDPARIDSMGRTGNQEIDGGSRRRKKARLDTQSTEEEEDARKKARGRPRVNTQDETPADRRRTQIRMAQRAYRHRKETTISSLEKQVQALKDTNEEMSNIFISLHDFALENGLLSREPEFVQQLRSTTERILALAKSSTIDDSLKDDENQGEEAAKQEHAEEGSERGRRSRGQRSSPKRRRESSPPVSEQANTWGGYAVTREDTPAEEIQMGHQTQLGFRYREPDFQIISRATEDNASFPFDLLDLQQYRVEVPSIEEFTHNFYPQQLPLPSTHSYNELSFARRIHRGATERAFRLITSKSPAAEKRIKEVFGFRLLYETREDIERQLRKIMAKTTKESLQDWRQPFVHLGGAGTHYPTNDGDIDEFMPKFRTGLSMGPFEEAISEAQTNLQDDLRITFPGFEGEFFDANDVEGYIRGRGLDIPPAADFVTADLDLLLLSEVVSPKSFDSASSKLSPLTPRSPIHKFLPGTDSIEDDNVVNIESMKEASTVPLHLSYTEWRDDSPTKTIESFNDVHVQTLDSATENSSRKHPSLDISAIRHYGERRTVTINVQTLLDEILSRTVSMASILPSCRITHIPQTHKRQDKTGTSTTHRKKFFTCVKRARTFLESIHQTSGSKASSSSSSSRYRPIPKSVTTSFPPETTRHPPPKAVYDSPNLDQEQNKFTRSFKRLLEVVKGKFSSPSQCEEIEHLWTDRFDLNIGLDISADKSELDYLRRTYGMGIITEPSPLLGPQDEQQQGATSFPYI